MSKEVKIISFKTWLSSIQKNNFIEIEQRIKDEIRKRANKDKKD
jgi:hypothetical protein